MKNVMQRFWWIFLIDAPNKLLNQSLKSPELWDNSKMWEKSTESWDSNSQMWKKESWIMRFKNIRKKLSRIMR